MADIVLIILGFVVGIVYLILLMLTCSVFKYNSDMDDEWEMNDK